MRQSLMDIRFLESSARVLQSRLDIVTAALSETLTALSTLEGTKGKPGETETLVPIGSGSFVKARLADAEKVIIGVGAGVCIEKPIEDSMKDLRLRSTEGERGRQRRDRVRQQPATRKTQRPTVRTIRVPQ